MIDANDLRIIASRIVDDATTMLTRSIEVRDQHAARLDALAKENASLERALALYTDGHDKIVEQCRAAGVDVDYCGGNAVSCVAELISPVSPHSTSVTVALAASFEPMRVRVVELEDELAALKAQVAQRDNSIISLRHALALAETALRTGSQE